MKTENKLFGILGLYDLEKDIIKKVYILLLPDPKKVQFIDMRKLIVT